MYSKPAYLTTNAPRIAVKDMNIHHRCHDVTPAASENRPYASLQGGPRLLLTARIRMSTIHLHIPSKLGYIFFTGGWPVWPLTAREQRGPTGYPPVLPLTEIPTPGYDSCHLIDLKMRT